MDEPVGQAAAPTPGARGVLRALGGRRLVRLARAARQWVTRARPVAGLPNGLAFETVDDLCQQRLGDRLSRVAHVHLSSWKPHGTHRLYLTTVAGRTWRLIFKDERYGVADIPALEGLPVRPGPPEFAIYRSGHPGLRAFLPEIHWSREVTPGRHFQYLMADLGDRLERLTTDRRDLILAVEVLLEVQDALQAAFAADPDSYLIAYDRDYSGGLLDYVRTNLDAYAATRDAPAVAALCRNWERIVTVHGRDEFDRPDLMRPIHGDYNRSNVRVDARNRALIRVVDWEWAGIGLPHADLAAVLKRIGPADLRAALEVFAQRRPELDFADHERLFRWCRLERRLLDAGFIARQQLASSRQLPRLDTFITGAAVDALRTADSLR